LFQKARKMYHCFYIGEGRSMGAFPIGKKTPRREGGSSPSNIKEIQEIQRGQEAPHNGGAISPKDA
jgi:hypothetical protein